MVSSLHKVQKHVNKKKGNKINSLHENSRDAKRLRRATNRDERVSRSEKLKRNINRKWLDRLDFFQDNLPDTIHPLELSTIRELINTFVARFDDEIAQLKSERRAGQPASTRQVLLEQTADTDRKEVESGFWIPNLQDDETLSKLDAWKGDWSSLGNMRFVRVSSNSDDLKDSQFPPRGAS